MEKIQTSIIFQKKLKEKKLIINKNEIIEMKENKNEIISNKTIKEIKFERKD
jgi:hypothetical protein